MTARFLLHSLQTGARRQLLVQHGGLDRPAFCGLGGRALRLVSWLVIAALLNTSFAPLARAMQHQKQLAAAQAAEDSAASNEQRYAQALQAIEQALQNENQGESQGSAKAMSTAALASAQTLQTYAEGIRQQSQQLRQQWQAAGVEAAILERQAAFEQQFLDKHHRLMALLEAAQGPAAKSSASAQASARRALQQFLADNAPRPAPSLIDWQRLPWQVQKPLEARPAESEAALQQKLGLPQAKAASAATAADTAFTPEAPDSPEIRQLAQKLERNPLKIYQWVHDHIHYTPTQGSVQGAADTLDKKAGNATDTASLLIALLRSSGIAARYVYGTVDIPLAQAQNWAGGLKTPEALQQILGQGGIANTLLVKGGQPVAIRMEHVWAEAFIQYHPGWGARHVPGQSVPDAWIPMDASFKQYTYSDGMDLQQAVPLDAAALISAAGQGAQVNEAEGWVQHLNTAALQGQLSAYQQRLKTYIDRQNGGQSTVGQVLGQRSAQIDPLPFFAATLPYEVKARSQSFGAIPDSLKARFRYAIYPDKQSAVLEGSPILQFEADTASLAGKKLTLAWVAASDADQRAIEALIPQARPGQTLKPQDLPRGLPASISLKPQILVEGAVKAEGSALRAGSEPVGAGAFTQYGSRQWDETYDQLIAGQQTALGLSIQGISQAQMERLEARMEETKQTLERAQAAPDSQREQILKGITGDMLTGDMLTATVWGYFASLQSQGLIAASQAQIVDAPALSYGLFHAQVEPQKIYGLVSNGVRYKGLNMDIGHVRSVRWVKDDNPSSIINNKPGLLYNNKTGAQNRWIAYNKAKGLFSSAMEHILPEDFWIDKTRCRDSNNNPHNQNYEPCAEGISAVKALIIAQQQGQKIYTINRSNAQSSLAKLSLSNQISNEIRNAVNAGKEVTVHEKAINNFGWRGIGYTVVDPDTGTGAYIIEGAGNGAVLFIAIAMLSFAFPPLWFVLVAGLGTVGSWISLAALVGSMIYGLNKSIETINKILAMNNLTQEEKDGTIKLVSSITVLANFLGGKKAAAGKLTDTAMISTLFILLANIMNAGVKGIAILFNYSRELAKGSS